MSSCVCAYTGSPLTVDVIDSRALTVTGSGLAQAEVNQMTTFTVDAGQSNGGSNVADSLQVFLRCTYLHCALSLAAQCISIGPVCGGRAGGRCLWRADVVGLLAR